MKRDIENKKDIVKLVDVFYEKVKEDPALYKFFSEVIPVNWDKHLAIMYKFWENVLFYTGTYSGNPMHQHHAIHEKSELSMKHFQQWTKLFSETVDELYEGKNASLIKDKAQSISTIMQIKFFK